MEVAAAGAAGGRETCARAQAFWRGRAVPVAMAAPNITSCCLLEAGLEPPSPPPREPLTEPSTPSPATAKPDSTPLPMPGPAAVGSAATHVVKMAVLLPLSEAAFDESSQAQFKQAIGAAAGAAQQDVGIDAVTAVIAAVPPVNGRRRLLAEDAINIQTSVGAKSREAAEAMAGKLTAANINAELQRVGLPAATIVEQPAVFEAAGGSEAGPESTQADGGGGISAGGVVGIIIGVLALVGGGFCLYQHLAAAPPTARKDTANPKAPDTVVAEARGLQTLASPAQQQANGEAHIGVNSLLGYVQSANYSPAWEQEGPRLASPGQQQALVYVQSENFSPPWEQEMMTKTPRTQQSFAAPLLPVIHQPSPRPQQGSPRLSSTESTPLAPSEWREAYRQVRVGANGRAAEKEQPKGWPSPAHATPPVPMASNSTVISIEGLTHESMWSYMYSPTRPSAGEGGIG